MPISKPVATKAALLGVENRRSRRSAMQFVIMQLSAIKAAELANLDRVPDNSRETDNCAVADNAVEMIDCALDYLDDAY